MQEKPLSSVQLASKVCEASYLIYKTFFIKSLKYVLIKGGYDSIKLFKPNQGGNYNAEYTIVSSIILLSCTQKSRIQLINILNDLWYIIKSNHMHVNTCYLYDYNINVHNLYCFMFSNKAQSIDKLIMGCFMYEFLLLIRIIKSCSIKTDTMICM